MTNTYTRTNKLVSFKLVEVCPLQMLVFLDGDANVAVTRV